MTTNSQSSYTLYFGTYTKSLPHVSARAEGIYRGRFDASNGVLSDIQLAAKTDNPSFLAIAPNGRSLYASNELMEYNGAKSGAVTAFSIETDGSLRPLNRQPAFGTAPCHVRVDATNRYLAAANYMSGSAALFPINADGSLAEKSDFIQHQGSGPNPTRQEGPHAHQVMFSPDNRFLMINDLGLDQVMVYRLDLANGKLPPNDPPFAKVHGGAGPRHLDFHPNGKLVYLLNEIDATVTVFQYDAARGALSEIQNISTLPANFNAVKGCADIHVHPSGKFVYASNRGHDTIAIFKVDEASGCLTALGHESTRGAVPRNFAIDPTGQFLLAANQNSGNIAIFHIDQETGMLWHNGQIAHVPTCVCIQFLY